MLDFEKYREKYGLSQPKLVERVRNVLLDMINTGEGLSGGRLPPEPELARALGVGRTTLRAALRDLESCKIIRRQQGAGTFVNLNFPRIKTEITKDGGFDELIRNSGYEPGLAHERIAVTLLPEKVLQMLSIPSPAEGLICERVFLANSERCLVCTDMIPLESLRREFRKCPEHIGRSIFDFLDECGEKPVDYGIAELIPVNASADVAKLLGIYPGQALLFIEEVYASCSGEPVMFSQIYLRPDTIRFSCLRHVERSASSRTKGVG